MFKNNLITLIKVDGQPLRETDGKYVHLPFNTEYSIGIKNQTARRACATIKIDGTSAIGEDTIIIPAGTDVEIERFLTDGNLSSGKRFKFVPLSDSKVQDPSSAENGLVEIEVWFEKLTPLVVPVPRPKPYWDRDEWTITNGTPEWSTGSSSVRSMGFMDTSTLSNTTRRGGTKTTFTPDSAASHYDVRSVLQMSVGSTAGATVEGRTSNQQFYNAYFGEKDYPSTVFRFWLRGVQNEVKSTDKLFCSNCGKKVRFDYKFCPRCGAPVQIA